MHDSVLEFLRDHLRRDEIFGKDVLEVGSQDVNGSPRTVVSPMGPRTYWGVDFVAGKGVDLELDCTKLVERFGVESFDVVISTEMLEHVEHWRESIAAMKAVLKPGGLLVLTARGPGFPYHGFPHDHWRYTVDDFRAVFADMRIEILKEDTAPGILFKGSKTPETGRVDLSGIEIRPVPVPPEMIRVGGSVDILVANWNTLPWLRLLRSQIRARPPRIPYQLFVWDNASTDGSAEWLKSEGVNHEASSVTYPHAESLHRSMERTTAPYVAFMDVDAIPIEWWWLDQAVGLLQDPKVGVVGLGTPVSWTRQRFVHPSFCVLRRSLYQDLELRPHVFHDPDGKNALEVNELLCRKVEKAGYRLEFVGEAQIDLAQRKNIPNRVIHAISSTPVLSEKRSDMPFIKMVNQVVSWHKILLKDLGIWGEFEGYCRDAVPQNPLASRYVDHRTVGLHEVRLSIVVPTCGRASLKQTLESILAGPLEPNDEVIVVGDGPQPAARAIVSGLPVAFQVHYVTARATRSFGGHQRNVGMGMAQGTHVLFMDDDDVYLPGALNIIRSALAQAPDRPHLFRVRNASARRPYASLWNSKSFVLGNVATPMIALPIVDGLLGTWPNGHCSDYAFLRDTLPRFGEDRIIWREEVVAELL
jgi:SAM-dependent methyltransferase